MYIMRAAKSDMKQFMQNLVEDQNHTLSYSKLHFLSAYGLCSVRVEPASGGKISEF